MGSAIRIGKINFTNVWPIFYHFPLERFGTLVKLIEQVPTGLNRAMAAGEIDMGPISSFAYGASCDHYILYPDLSVSAFGEVKSILLFHEKPLEEVAQGRVMLPTTSATSVNLLKIILHKFYDGAPTYDYAPPNLEKMMQHADAALLIGDDAIKAGWANTRYRVTDLGELWNRHTGLWMTFAVWAVRRKTAELHPDLVAQVYDAFVQSKERGKTEKRAMIRDAMARVGGDETYWAGYFSQLRYDFGPEQRAGLEAYFRYAWELGLLDRPVPIQLWNEKFHCG